MTINHDVIACDCHSTEHDIRFCYMDFEIDNDDDEHDMLSMHVFLNHNAWYKRIWYGIKYILGYKSRYGHFDETLINYDEAQKMIRVLQQVKNPNPPVMLNG